MPFDRRVADFSWLLAHGVVLNADRLRPSFRMSSVPPDCFCGAPLENAGHLFFEYSALWPRTFWLGCSHC